jgi:ankyrin repeat protein
VTPLHIAASIGSLDIINKLLAAGADIDAKENRVTEPPPPMAARRSLPGTHRAHSLALLPL